MKKYIFIFISLFLLTCSKVDLRESAKVIVDSRYISNPRNNEFKGYLNDYFKKTGSPGCILLVSEADTALWVGSIGYSDLENQKLFSTSTQFRVGSITKIFISTIVLKLAEEGKIFIDEKVTDYLPELENKIPGIENVTVRHLLANISGIVDPPNQNLNYQADIVNNPEQFSELSNLQLLEKYVYGKELLFKSGTEYNYSNAGYWILGILIEKIEKKPIEYVLFEKICLPLGLDSTYIGKYENDNVAKGYTNSAGKTLKDVTVLDMAEGDGKTAGGIISNVDDINTFLNALFNFQIISETTLNEMKRIQLSGCNNIDCEYGLGMEVWKLKKHTGYGHNGSLIGIEVNALYFPDKKTTIIIFKNLGGGSDKSFIDSLLR
jgi:D-alanyl-D-alanine carboxypeptidase